jgi:hypothetical protein
MITDAEKRLAKWNWARNNPATVREANLRWRNANVEKVRRQARARMRRYRARRNTTGAGTTPLFA